MQRIRSEESNEFWNPRAEVDPRANAHQCSFPSAFFACIHVAERLLPHHTPATRERDVTDAASSQISSRLAMVPSHLLATLCVSQLLHAHFLEHNKCSTDKMFTQLLPKAGISSNVTSLWFKIQRKEQSAHTRDFVVELSSQWGRRNMTFSLRNCPRSFGASWTTEMIELAFFFFSFCMSLELLEGNLGDLDNQIGRKPFLVSQQSTT